MNPDESGVTPCLIISALIYTISINEYAEDIFPRILQMVI